VITRIVKTAIIDPLIPFDPVQELHEEEHRVAAEEGKEQRAQSLDTEGDEEQRFAPAFLGVIAGPRRQHSDRDLGHDDETRHVKRSAAPAERQIFADDRQH
jgi:hypothetical protein